MAQPSLQQASFGVFEADLASGELRRQGRLVHLQQQPFELLRVLLEHPGTLVEHDVLRARLWPDGVTVEFDQGLHKCATKLRDALGDDARSPRFVETLPRRGYRFIAPVRWTGPDASADAWPSARHAAPAPAAGARWPVRRLLAAAATLAAVGVLLVFGPRLATGTAPVEASVLRPTGPGLTPIFAARDAHDRADAALARRTDAGLKQSVTLFERAVALGRHYGPAYAGLADAWSRLGAAGHVDPHVAMPRARDAAEHALTLDPGLARAHVALARVALGFDGDIPAALWHARRALAIDPGNAAAHQAHAEGLLAAGRTAEAVSAARRGVRAAPLDSGTASTLARVLVAANQWAEAAQALTRVVELDPGDEMARARLIEARRAGAP